MDVFCYCETHWDKIFIVIFLVTIVSEYVLSPHKVFYLFYDLWSFLVIQVVVFQPVLFLLAGFPTVPLGFGIHVLWPPLQDSPRNGHLDCNAAVPGHPRSFHVLPWLPPLASLTGTWPIIWPMWIGEKHLPVVYAWMEGAIAPCTATGTVPWRTLAPLMTLLECHMSSTRTGWTATNWQRSCTLLAFLDGIERRLLNCHEMHQQALQRVGVICDVKACSVEVDLPVRQHHLEELNVEHSLVIGECVICSWKLGHKLVQMA
jgi:hypothetical protein